MREVHPVTYQMFLMRFRVVSISVVSVLAVLAMFGATHTFFPQLLGQFIAPCTLAAGVVSCTPQSAKISGDLTVTQSIYEQGKTLSAKYQEDIHPDKCPLNQVVTGIDDAGNLTCGSITATLSAPSACLTTQRLTFNGTDFKCTPILEGLTWNDVVNLPGSPITSGGTAFSLSNFNDMIAVKSTFANKKDSVACPPHHPVRVSCGNGFMSHKSTGHDDYYVLSRAQAVGLNGCELVGGGDEWQQVAAYCIVGQTP